MNKLFAIIALPLLLLAGLSGCGGGGGEGDGSTTDGEFGTAAQFFNKNAVGNTWTTLDTNTNTAPGQPTSTSVVTSVSTISSSAGGVVSFYDTTTSTSPGVIYYPYTYTVQLDGAGALVSTDQAGTSLVLPATFSVGTTWVIVPADPATGQGAVTVTVAAFGITRTVPAGTFTDCLQLNATGSDTSGGVTTTFNQTVYLSPTAGTVVESASSYSGTDGSNGIFASSLQAGYIANP